MVLHIGKPTSVARNYAKSVPAKVLRYFPLIPRLRRMFRSIEKAEQVLWHSNHKSQDRKMRHPVDSLVWNRINKKWPDFASEPQNLRLGLSVMDSIHLVILVLDIAAGL